MRITDKMIGEALAELNRVFQQLTDNEDFFRLSGDARSGTYIAKRNKRGGLNRLSGLLSNNKETLCAIESMSLAFSLVVELQGEGE